MNEPKSPPFDHPQNITVGLARVIYGTYGYSWSQRNGWHLPGKRFTTDRHEAYTYAVRINRALGGVEVTTT